MAGVQSRSNAARIASVRFRKPSMLGSPRAHPSSQGSPPHPLALGSGRMPDSRPVTRVFVRRICPDECFVVRSLPYTARGTSSGSGGRFRRPGTLSGQWKQRKWSGALLTALDLPQVLVVVPADPILTWPG